MAEPPVSRSPRTTGRVALGLGLAALLVAMLGLVLVVAVARNEMLRQFYVIDPGTGVVIDMVSWHQRLDAARNVHYEVFDRRAVLLGIGWVGLALTWWGVRRRERSTGLRLRRVAAPLLLPIAAMLIAATMLTFSVGLEWLLERFTRAGAVTIGDCFGTLSHCSQLRSYDLLRVAVLGVSGISVALLIPAAQEAWRAGVRGRELSRAGRVAAIVCFCVGSVAFISTRTIREDHQHTFASCEGEIWPRSELEYAANGSSTDLQAAHVRVLRSYWEFAASNYGVGVYQILADGELSSLPTAGEQHSVDGLSNATFQAELSHHIEIYEEHGESPVLELYVDERVSLARMRELLEIARTAGVSTVLVLGEAHIEGRLPSIGSWTRRVHAPHAKLLLGQDELGFDAFTTWKQLSDTAAGRGPEGLSP
jgi:hypothetical protein